jgi:hypothetical protein
MQGLIDPLARIQQVRPGVWVQIGSPRAVQLSPEITQRNPCQRASIFRRAGEGVNDHPDQAVQVKSLQVAPNRRHVPWS